MGTSVQDAIRHIQEQIEMRVRESGMPQSILKEQCLDVSQIVQHHTKTLEEAMQGVSTPAEREERLEHVADEWAGVIWSDIMHKYRRQVVMGHAPTPMQARPAIQPEAPRRGIEDGGAVGTLPDSLHQCLYQEYMESVWGDDEE